jgi:3-phosphoshikimate 1-carboxyvinyltransferase
LRPGSVVSGVVTVPGSKSIAQRALVAAGLASGTTRLTRVPAGGDVQAAVQLVEDAGAVVERLAPAALAITGRPPGPHRGWKPARALAAGESGTLARLATAAAGFCALAGHGCTITVGGTLARRKSAALFAALRAAGVRLETEGGAEGASWPARLIPIGPPNRVRLVEPRSSQEASALLVALAAYPDTLELEVVGAIPSRPYLELTLETLGQFGARVATFADARGERFEVKGPLVAPADPIAIEPDASAAAVALAAGWL